MKKINKAQPREKRLAHQMESQELVTPFRLFIVLVISASMITAISFSAANQENFVFISPEEEINLTKTPYVFSYQRAMKTRQENLEIYNHPSINWVVEKRSKLSVDEFWDIYDCKWPVIITDVVDKWPAMNWSKDYFIKQYGREKVMVKLVDGLTHASVSAVQLQDFIKNLDKTTPESWTYLEDELFLVSRPELRKSVGSNIYAEENFFNLFPDEVKPWDCLFLWGTKYSRSTLHMDPYNWTATNAVLSGSKLWKLFPPEQDHLLYIYSDRKCNFPLDCKKYDSPIDAFNPNYNEFPLFRKAQYIVTEVPPGEMLIIPTGWYHQAYNSKETISISNQIMNRNNYLVVLEEIIKGRNIKRKKIPAHFNTLLPPDQVKLFMSLLPEQILKHGKELTEGLLKGMHAQGKK